MPMSRSQPHVRRSGWAASAEPLCLYGVSETCASAGKNNPPGRNRAPLRASEGSAKSLRGDLPQLSRDRLAHFGAETDHDCLRRLHWLVLRGGEL